jgi:general secretion pathway protein F
MSRFSYLALAPPARRVAGTLRSPSRPEAVRRLMELGFHPLSVEAIGERSASGGWTFWRRVRLTELAVFTRQLAALLKAGLPMVEALSTLRSQTGNPRLGRVLEDIQEMLTRDAAMLSDALEEHPRLFDPVYRGLVRAGEESGELPEVLADLATHLSRSARLRGQVLGAFIYPLFLVLLGAAAIFVLVSFVIPRFEDLFVSFGQTLPWPTRVLLACSGFMGRWWPAVLAVIAASVLGAAVVLRRPAVRAARDRAAMGMPVLGPMWLKLEIARLARTWGALTASGVRMLESLRITGQTAHNLRLGATFTQIAAAVEAGASVADAVEATRAYPPMMVNLIRTGEHTGELPEMLTELAQIYEEEAERAVAGAVKLLEPTLIVLLGGIIAGIVAAVILPVFQANALVSN